MTNLTTIKEQEHTMTNSDTTTEVAIRPTTSEIVEWCKDYVARMLNVSVDKLDANTEFDALGVDSAAAVALVMDICAWLDRDLEPATLFEYPTISAFSEYLART
jgi:acyl carrier protein